MASEPEELEQLTRQAYAMLPRIKMGCRSNGTEKAVKRRPQPDYAAGAARL